MDDLFYYYDTGIESYWQYRVKRAGEYADYLEAKETWWEYMDMIGAAYADEASDKSLPDEVFLLTESWL